MARRDSGEFQVRSVEPAQEYLHSLRMGERGDHVDSMNLHLSTRLDHRRLNVGDGEDDRDLRGLRNLSGRRCGCRGWRAGRGGAESGDVEPLLPLIKPAAHCDDQPTALGRRIRWNLELD